VQRRKVSLHNPAALGALTLPHPPARFNLLEPVAVVVDPFLGQHLRKHQQEGVTFLYECIMGYREMAGCGAILADEMGLGKTLQTIALLWTLLKQGPKGNPVCKRVLIVTPGSLVKNWEKEIKKWLGNERLPSYTVGPDKRMEGFAKMSTRVAPVCIISYEMLLREIADVKKVGFDLIITDESHRLKNATSKTAVAIMGLQAKRRVALTGTPIQNNLKEFHAIVEFVNPGLLGTSHAFARLFETPVVAARQPNASAEVKELGDERLAELNRMTDLFCLRRTSETNNEFLPPKDEYVVMCPISPLQRTLYQALLSSKHVTRMVEGRGGTEHLRCIGALKKLCNHPALLFAAATDEKPDAGDTDVNGLLAQPSSSSGASLFSALHKLYPSGYSTDRINIAESGKLVVLMQLLDTLHRSNPNTATRERIIVVSHSTKCLDVIEAVCTERGYQQMRLEGSTPTEKRVAMVDRFNSPHSNSFMMLLSSKAGGVGLNIIGASRLVLYDIDWNPANDLQAMARIWYVFFSLSNLSSTHSLCRRPLCRSTC